jgi:hypothetical protein
VLRECLSVTRPIDSALPGKTTGSRQRDMRLKVLTDNAMILEALSDKIDTGQQETSLQKQ